MGIIFNYLTSFFRKPKKPYKKNGYIYEEGWLPYKETDAYKVQDIEYPFTPKVELTPRQTAKMMINVLDQINSPAWKQLEKKIAETNKLCRESTLRKMRGE